MNDNNIDNQSKEALLLEQKKNKKTKIITAFLMGLLLGIAVYSSVKNGIGFFTFFPLLFVYLLYKNSMKTNEREKEINARLNK